MLPNKRYINVGIDSKPTEIANPINEGTKFSINKVNFPFFIEVKDLLRTSLAPTLSTVSTI